MVTYYYCSKLVRLIHVNINKVAVKILQRHSFCQRLGSLDVINYIALI